MSRRSVEHRLGCTLTDERKAKRNPKTGVSRLLPKAREMHPSAASFLRHRDLFGPLFSSGVLRKGMVPIDLSKDNLGFGPEVYSSLGRFSSFIDEHIRRHGAALAFGGYCERREVYALSPVFDARPGGVGARRIHMGLDFWGEEGTPVLAPADGLVHSLAMNAADGDYGATIVLRHEFEGFVFHTLYGHMSATDLSMEEGSHVRRGEILARFGGPAENGNWPPHLHLQVVIDMGGRKGDFPGVCSEDELESFMKNCPDPRHVFSN